MFGIDGFIIFMVCLCLFFFWVYRQIVKESNAPYTRHFTTRVRVPATWRNNDPDWADVPIRDGVADFLLGIGPCGLEVVAIYSGWNEGGKNFYVTQKCSNGERKTFTYRREDITGRIEETIDSETINPKEKK